MKMASRKPLQTRTSPSKTTKQEDARIIAVGDHLSSVVTQSGGGMNAGEENQGWIAKKRGSIVREGCKSLRSNSGTQQVGNLRTGALKEAVLRSVAISRDGNMEPEEFRQGVRRRYCDVQSQSRWRSAARKNIGLLGHKQDIEQ